MSSVLPQVVLVRHGETAWSTPGRHTGRTDLPLTEAGQKEAARLALRLSKFTPDRVWASPLIRAHETAKLAGYPNATVDPDLMEWNYGTFEGMTIEEIHQQSPGWSVFHDGGPRGESVAEATERADRVVTRLRELEGSTLIFSHGHFSKVLAARWCGLPLDLCAHLAFNTTALSVLGYDRNKSRPAILGWNIRESFLQNTENRGEEEETDEGSDAIAMKE